MPRKFTRYEKKEIKEHNVAEAMSGGGVYIYENSSSTADLQLPRATRSGLRKIGPNQQFQGDDYYMQLVRTGMLKCINVVQTAEQEKEALMEEQKLIVDQPDRITTRGQVEHVVQQDVPKQKLNEDEKQPVSDVLLNESPGDESFVIVTD